MEIRMPPDREAHLTALAANAGRSPDEIVQEGVALWEEREHRRAEILTAVDKAKASLAQGKGRVITQDSMRALANEVHQRGLARLTAEQQKPAR
jgi:Arc/MetJ-type ribon-helix-helix transcriptional regulator